MDIKGIALSCMFALSVSSTLLAADFPKDVSRGIDYTSERVYNVLHWDKLMFLARLPTDAVRKKLECTIPLDTGEHISFQEIYVLPDGIEAPWTDSFIDKFKCRNIK